MDPCPESPFRDLSPFADLLWLRTNELTLLPDELTCFFDSGAAKTFLEHSQRTVDTLCRHQEHQIA